MLTHGAPSFLLEAWTYRPGKTLGDAYCISAALPTHTNPLPPPVTGKEHELSRTTDKLHLAVHRARAGTQVVIPGVPQGQHPTVPQEVVFPFPHPNPTAPWGKGATLILSSQHLASSASLQKCQTGRM